MGQAEARQKHFDLSVTGELPDPFPKTEEIPANPGDIEDLRSFQLRRVYGHAIAGRATPEELAFLEKHRVRLPE